MNGCAAAEVGTEPLRKRKAGVIVAPLTLKRWILGTHQGSASLQHLASYLEEFTFRFNRRRARRITHGAERLLGIAMATPPRPFWKIVGRPHPEGKARLAVAA